jgi:adenylate kinase
VFRKSIDTTPEHVGAMMAREPAAVAALDRSRAAADGPRLLIVGPPGTAKGATVALLAERFGVPAISTGELFRASVKRGADLGKQLQAIVSEGGDVPGPLTNEIVRERLHQPDASGGFILDGYPRTADQVAAIDALLTESGARLDAVVQLQAHTEALVERLLERAPAKARADAAATEVIRFRLARYEQETAPLIEAFAVRGLLVTVDGLGELAEVTAQIHAALAERGLNVLTD